MISIITATYNRAHTLPKLYNSLLKNKKYDKNMEWIIIDDGSIDDTCELVRSWIKEKKLNIKYYKQKNKGKMSAINNYIDKAINELCVEVDSDDYLCDNALKIVLDSYTNEVKSSHIYGMLFKKNFMDKDKPKNLPKKGIRKIFDLYNKDGFTYDSAIVFKSEIRKKYTYKLENNEKFITEARMYNKLDLDYDGVYLIDEAIINCEYFEDGYSKNIDKIFINNPYGYFEYFKECFLEDFTDLKFNKRMYFIKHYILFGYLSNKKKIYLIKNVKGIINKILVIILIIPGYIKSKNRFNNKLLV